MSNEPITPQEGQADRVSEAVGTELSDVRSATLSSIDAIRDAVVDSARSMRAAGRAGRE